MSLCQKCGAENPEPGEVCAGCGAPLNDPSAICPQCRKPLTALNAPCAACASAEEDEGNWLDGQASAYSDWMKWLHLIICQCPGLIVGLLFLLGCRTSDGKKVGKQLLKFSGLGLAIAVVLRIIIETMKVAFGR